MKIKGEHEPLIQKVVNELVEIAINQDYTEQEYELEFPNHPGFVFIVEAYLHEKGKWNINPEKSTYESYVEVTKVRLIDEDCKEIELPKWVIDMFPRDY